MCTVAQAQPHTHKHTHMNVMKCLINKGQIIYNCGCGTLRLIFILHTVASLKKICNLTPTLRVKEPV